MMRPAFKIILLLVTLSAATANAQLFKGGAVLGFNASQVDGDTYAGYNHFGFMVGAFIYTGVSDKLDIQFEIKYMGKGAAKPSSKDEYDLTRYRSNLHYIEMPVVLRLNTPSHIGLEGGLGFGYLFAYSEEDAYGTLPERQASKFRPFELSIILGGSYEITEKWRVGLRYSYSLLPIINYADAWEVPIYFRPRGAYNNLFTLGMNYTL